MSIGKNIAKYRKAKGLTQEGLGAKLGVTNQAVSKWESEISMPDVMLLPQIADALNITLNDLYGIARSLKRYLAQPMISLLSVSKSLLSCSIITQKCDSRISVHRTKSNWNFKSKS